MALKPLSVGRIGNSAPPMDSLIAAAQQSETAGCSSLWWADHLMSSFPQSIWTPDITPAAKYQKNADSIFDCVASLAVAAMSTQKMIIGSLVTEPVRRHPAMLAQEFLTLDHIAKGRMVLGIGCGEAENIVPYGFDFRKPVSRLEEAIKIIRLLWESEGPISYDGEFWKLDRAVLGLEPYNGRFPPIWVAANGPRMLEITGRLGDGWAPMYMGVEEYAKRLATIKKVAENNGRDFDKFTPSLLAFCVLDRDHEECHRVMQQPILKSLALMLPNECFTMVGAKHPFGCGLLHYVPSHVNRGEVLAAIDQIPWAISENHTLHGTPEEVAEELQRFAAVGLQHVVLGNITPLGDLSKAGSSNECLAEVFRLLA